MELDAISHGLSASCAPGLACSYVLHARSHILFCASFHIPFLPPPLALSFSPPLSTSPFPIVRFLSMSLSPLFTFYLFSIILHLSHFHCILEVSYCISEPNDRFSNFLAPAGAPFFLHLPRLSPCPLKSPSLSRSLSLSLSLSLCLFLPRLLSLSFAFPLSFNRALSLSLSLSLSLVSRCSRRLLSLARFLSFAHAHARALFLSLSLSLSRIVIARVRDCT